ncbi:arginine-glutamic acid dipeptide repeats protein-like isoform X3 [Eriocheir sinensis]|uniref:arginine-glutamic acid dipeptide repeats protein-like isoform X3 n=1 Tax=Eriocheir sinensis TaxID=95602 RepID=UPI0021C74015|nr:arginine-glutamic acid dipeptide repeats protein-like isoform X3 [Eriocheir sinensis]
MMTTTDRGKGVEEGENGGAATAATAAAAAAAAVAAAPGGCTEAAIDPPPSSTSSSNSNSSSASIPPSGVMVPGGPKGPDGTVIEEVMTAVVGKKQPVRGQAFRAPNGEYVSYLCTDDTTLYRPGDSVYIESQRADQPFFICSIQEFRRSKRDTLMVNIKWFYRPSEVPETVYQRLAQDRNTENTPSLPDNKSLVTDDPVIKSRELFISDATDTYPVSVLRGLCRVDHYSDIHSVRDFLPEDNSFFYILGYNPETRRLASTQGEIRVGPSHQAKLPEFKGNVIVDERPEVCADWEEQRWVPGASRDTDLLMYLRAARSMAAFAGLCDGGSTTDGCNAASRDDTTINALEMLHNSDYDHGKALQALVKCPVPDGIEKKWSEDERKRFMKGLRQYGKNFFRIRKDLLPHKETSDLVSFYYLWKKTPAAAGHRPHRRHRRQNVLRRIRTPRAQRNTGPSDPLDPSSASEKDDDSDDSDSKDRQGYHCRHCYTTSSRDWHHAGKDKQLLCYECRIHFKRYGDLPVITNPREPPPGSGRPPPTPTEEDLRMRTRTRSKEITTRHRAARRSRANTPDITDECPTPDRRTPDRRTPDRRTARLSSSPAPKKVEDKNPRVKRAMGSDDASGSSTPSKRRRNGGDMSGLSTEESSDEGDGGSGDPSSPSPMNPSTPTPQLLPVSTPQAPEAPISSPAPQPPSNPTTTATITTTTTPTTTASTSPPPPSPMSLPPVAPPVSSTITTTTSTSTTTTSSPAITTTATSLSSVTVSMPSASPVSSIPSAPAPASPPHPTTSSHLLPHSSAASSSPAPAPKPRQLVPPGSLWSIMPGSPAPATTTTSAPMAPAAQVNPTWSSVVQTPLASTAMPRLSPGGPVPPPPPAHSGSAIQPQVITRISSAPPPPPAQQPPLSTPGKPLSGPPSIPISGAGMHGPGMGRPGMAGVRMVPQSVPPASPRTSALTVVAPVASVGSAPPVTAAPTPLRPGTSMEDRGSVVRAPVSSVPHSVLAPQAAPPHSAPAPGPPPALHDKPPKVKTEADMVRYPPGLHHPGLRPPPTSIHGHPPAPPPSHHPPPTSQPPAPTSTAPLSLACTSSSSISGLPSGYPATVGAGAAAVSRPPLMTSSGMLPYPPPAGLIKPEQIKREAEPPYRPDKIKYEPSSGPPAAHHPAPAPAPPPLPEPFKMEVPKVEPKLEIKQERGDRPEIIAEIKSEPRHEPPKPPPITMPPGLTPGSLGSLPVNLCIPGYPYPYAAVAGYGYPLPLHYYPTPTHPRTTASTIHRPQSPSQRPGSSGGSSGPPSIASSRASPPTPSFTSTGSSATVTTSSTTTKPSTIPGAYAPPHLGPAMYGGRPGVPPHLSSPGKLPTSQPAQAPPGVRPPGPAVGLPGMSPGLPPGMPPGLSTASGGPAPLPTPPAAHTGPVVKPPSMPVNLSQSSSGPPASQPPTTQALPATVPPSHPSYPGGPTSTLGPAAPQHDEEHDDGDDDLPMHREPSPEPKIEDSEFHRSESAIFLRHWNRGEFNSCTRTDLTFKPVPNSQLARKREERLRKQAEKEREEREKVQQRKASSSTPDKRETPKPSSSGEGSSLYDRMQPRNPVDTPALSRLGEYARSPAGLSPGAGRPPGLGLPSGLGGGPPPGLDLLHYGSMLYPPASQERMELEAARERELRELRDRELTDRIKQEMLKRPLNPADPAYPHGLSPHWLSGTRFPTLPPPVTLGSGFPHSHPLYAPSPSVSSAMIANERDRLERLGLPATTLGLTVAAPPSENPLSVSSVERLALADHMHRLQMFNEVHAHTHSHAHTHLHLHPGAAAAAAAAGYPPRPLMRPGDPSPHQLPPGYPPQSHHALLGRPYEELAHMMKCLEGPLRAIYPEQITAAHAHEIQRQMLIERERFPHLTPGGPFRPEYGHGR